MHPTCAMVRRWEQPISAECQILSTIGRELYCRIHDGTIAHMPCFDHGIYNMYIYIYTHHMYIYMIHIHKWEITEFGHRWEYRPFIQLEASGLIILDVEISYPFDHQHPLLTTPGLLWFCLGSIQVSTFRVKATLPFYPFPNWLKDVWRCWSEIRQGLREAFHLFAKKKRQRSRFKGAPVPSKSHHCQTPWGWCFHVMRRCWSQLIVP